jgi:hypothetical protein
MLGKMKASLDAALKKSLEEGNTNADIEALKKLAQRRRLEKIKATIQVSKDVTAVLEDPPLPSAADLERWWPEPKQTFVMNPLVTYGTLAGHELEMLRLHEERRRPAPNQSLTANETTEPIVLPQAPYLPVSPRAAGGDGISPNRSKRQLKYPMLQIQIQTPRSNSELLNAPLTAPLSPREGTGTTGLNHLTSSNLAGQAPLTSSSIGAPGLQAQVSYTSSIGGQALLRPQSRPGTLESGRPRSSTWGSSMSRSRSPTQGKRPSLSHSPRRAPSRLDPSRAFGNPTTIVLPEDEDDTKDAFNLERFIGAVGRPGERRPDSPPSFMRLGDTTLQLETIDRSNRLTHWMEVFQADEEAFASKAVFVEMRLRQALSSSVQLGTPNAFRTAIVCDAFERVAPMTGRYQGVLELCWKELMQSIFLDYSPDLPGTGAKVYAERTPYFLEVKRLRDLTEEQNKTMKRMKLQRDAELAEIQARNQLINKVADKWNKALAGSQASKEADALKLRVESMQQLLGDAQREVQKMHHEQYKEPMQKLVEAYQMCEDHERESVLIEHIFPSPSAASVWTTVTPDQAALWIIQFFSKMKPASLAGPKEATRGRVLESLFTVMNLPPDEKMPLAVSLLATHYDARQVGETLANVMIAKASESVLATDSKVPLYRQSIHGFVDELDSSNPDDPRATVKHQVVLELKRCLGVISSDAPEPTRQQFDMSLPSMPPKSVSFGAKAGLPTSAAAAAAEAAAIRDKIADLKRRQALGLLTPEEEAELRALEARLAQLDEVASGGGKGSKRKQGQSDADRMADLLRRQAAGELTPEEAAELARLQAQNSGQSDADRMADLLRRQAAGELTPEEAAELARLQAKNPDAAEAARLADLKRRQKLGQLTPEEEAELRRLEAKFSKDGIPTDPDEAAREAQRCRDRIADLERRKALGQLTPEEEAELAALKKKLEKLDRVAGKGGKGNDAEAARLADLKRRQKLGQLTPEEEAELRRLEAKLGGIPTDPKARAAEEAAVRDRIADLKRRQALGQLTPEEEAELRALEAKLKKLEDANAADRMAALKKKKPLSPEEEAELRALEAKMGGRGYGGSGSGNGRDVACQTDGDLGPPSLKRQGTMYGSMQDVSDIGGKGGMPDRAITSLCEIKFNRKDVKAMNTLMCRRILSALYQVKIEANDEADKQKRPRQSFPDFVPDQFVVLYGIKSLAIKNINEFLYGVRAERYRKDEKANLTEPEPLLMPFWQGSWHGVPQQERMPMEMFEFYLDMLAGVAKTVSEEHTLQLKGVGAFWNMLGSMNEISIPVFVLINCITKMFEKSHKELFERMKQGVLRTASVNLKEKQKRDKEGKPKPFPSYKEALLGKEGLDSRGYVAVHQFLNLALESDKKQTEKDSKFLDDAYQTWVAFKKENTYEVFVECLKESSPELPDADVINLYNLATSGDNPDVPDFKLICKTLRAKDIHLVRKGGVESITKQKIDDMKTMTKMTRLFVDKTPDNVDDPPLAPEPEQSEAGTKGGDSGAPGEVSKPKSWKMAKSVAMFTAAATTKRNIRALLQEMEMAEAEEQ